MNLVYTLKLMILVNALLALSIADVMAQSNRKYVSDVLHVPVRTGASSGHRILRHIKSGDVVTLLQFTEGDEYARIKVQDEAQTEGWVISRFLLDEPIAQIKLARLEKQLEKVKVEQAPLRDTASRLNQDLNQAKSELRALSKEKENLSKDLAEIRRVSSDKIDLHDRNKGLQSELQALQMRFTELQQENALLLGDRRNEGIKLGLLAVGIGGLAGLILPYLKPRGRKSRSIRMN